MQTTCFILLLISLLYSIYVTAVIYWSYAKPNSTASSRVATLRHNNEYATRLSDSFGLETFQYPNVSHFFSSSKLLK